MSRAVVTAGLLRGELPAPPSKSAAHRALICAALAEGESVLSPMISSDDMAATIGAAAALGASAASEDNTIKITGREPTRPILAEPVRVNCLESGSTLRFLVPVFGALGIPARFTGKGRLPDRPLGCYLDCLPENGLACETHGGLPLTVSGRLQPGVYRLPGNVSSQFITGLLLALPLLSGDSEIFLTTTLESAGYVEMTVDAMKAFGVTVEKSASGWHVPGGQSYRSRALPIEGDWSQAAFFLAAAALGGEVALRGLHPDSHQGDREALELFRQFGAQIEWDAEGNLRAQPGPLRGISIDAGQIPDLVPALAACAALCEGRTVITHAERLRLKESDRLKTVCEGLCGLGANVRETKDGLVINGVKALRGGTVDGAGDHRIVMALAVAATRAAGPVTILGAEAVNKSYPGFWEDFKRLGGNADVILG